MKRISSSVWISWTRASEQMVGDGAVAGNVKPSANALDDELVNVQRHREIPCATALRRRSRSASRTSSFRFLDGGRLAFDVGEDGGDFVHIVAHICFEFGDLIVGVLEGHALVEFNVLLNVEFAVEILHADVVDVQIVAGGDGANAVEDIFRTLGARQRLNGHVGIGKDVAHRDCDGFDKLLGTLEGYGAGADRRRDRRNNDFLSGECGLARFRAHHRHGKRRR